MTVRANIRGIVRPLVRSITGISSPANPWDEDALARISQIETAKGSAMSSGQKSAINSFIVAEKAAGRWASHLRIYLPVWGNAATNSICLASGTTGTMVNNPTQGAGFMQGNGSSSYFNTGSSPSALGATSASASMWHLILAPDSRNDGRWSGWRGSGTERFAFGFSGYPSVNFAFGSTATGGNFTNDTRAGIFIASNETATSRFTARRSTTGNTLLGTQSVTEATALLDLNVFFAAWNVNNGGAAVHSDAKFGGFGFGLGMSQEAAAAFTLNVKNLFEALTGLSIGAAPSFSVAPGVTGATTPGATLTRTLGTTAWGETVSGQWYKNGAPTGSTGATYGATSPGDEVFWRSSATNADGSATADSNIISVSSAPTHANLPILGTATVKPVAWSNDENDDAYSNEFAMAMHILGRINLIWHDNTSSTDASIANQNTSGYNPTLGTAYYNQEIIDRASDRTAAGNSGWDLTSVPALAGTYEGHIVPVANVDDAVRRSSPPSASASLITAIEANATADQPVLYVCGGPLTTLADAYLSKTAGADRAAFAEKVTVVLVAGVPGSSGGWYNEWADSMAARIIFKRFNCVMLGTDFATITGVNVGSGSTSMTCAATTLHVGQVLVHASLPVATYITATNGTTTATLSSAATSALSGASVLINRGFPMVPKPWLIERLPNSALVSRMFAKARTGNNLPLGIDGDGCSLVTLLDPAIVTAVTRYSVGSGGEATFSRNQGGATPSRNLPAVSSDVAGNLWYCTGVDVVKMTDAWWGVMTNPLLWTKSADLVFTPIATSGGTDNFDRANGAIGANWGQFGAIAQGSIASNRYAKSTTGYAYAVPVATYTNDQYAQFKVTQTPAANYFASIGVRNAFASGSDVNGYQFYSTPANSFVQTGSGGTYSNVHSSMPAFVAGDTIRVAMKGDQMTVWRNNGAESLSGVVKDGFKLLAVSTRTEHATGKPSLLCSRNAGPTEFGDDWVSGNVT